MTPDLPAGQQSRQSTILGWVLFVLFAVLLWNIITMPRTALEEREPLRYFHYSLGLIVSILAFVRIWWWRKEPAPTPPDGLPDSSFGFNRAILMAVLIVFAVESVIGFIYTWGIGHDVVLFGIHLPALLAKSEPIRMSMGYLHSALGFYYLMLFCIWLAYGFYQKFRFHVGLKRLFPGASV
jgi:cytochrome b561